MIPILPDDIINLVASELLLREDFPTLFNLALCSRQFASFALPLLYRMQHASPVKTSNEPVIGGKTRTAKNLGEQTRRWASLWRSIVLSTKGQTIFPYSRYVRVLDLQDLVSLLDDLNGKHYALQKVFFKDLEEFKGSPRTYRSRTIVDETEVSMMMGDEITKHTPLLEELTGRARPPVLATWLSRLPRLRSLRLYDGSDLQDSHTAVRQCPDFREIFILHWSGDTADGDFAAFLLGLRPNSLERITIHGRFMGEQSFAALATHSRSLKSMHLQISPAALVGLPLMKDATFLEDISLADDTPSPEDSSGLESTTADDLSTWLSSCTRLRSLTIEKFLFGGALIGSIISTDIRLRHLVVRIGMASLVPEFYRGLRNQTSLTSLDVRANPDAFQDDMRAGEEFLDSLCALVNLRQLKLVDVSDYFMDEHICRLGRSLPLLEELTVGSVRVSDEVWGDLANMKRLRLLGFTGLSQFTLGGIMNFVNSLDRGINLEIMAVTNPLGDEDKAKIEKIMAYKGGTLFYTPWREEEDSFDEDEDD